MYPGQFSSIKKKEIIAIKLCLMYLFSPLCLVYFCIYFLVCDFVFTVSHLVVYAF